MPLEDLALAALRLATAGTKYEGLLYLVGGALRDRYLGEPHGADLDFVLEGDAVELARMLHQKGLSTHFPVLYPRFGTAMIHLSVGNSGVDVELVTARSESYQPDSRKPDIGPGTLKEDIYRRDFTINTLAENLHTGELLDITGLALPDLDAGILRTPVEPEITFFDDPLRMLRAVRLASRFQFQIEQATWSAIRKEAARLRPPTIALERIREEFVKIVLLPGRKFRTGMELLNDSGLLAEFLPEMLPMYALTGNANEDYSLWRKTMLAIEYLPDDAPLEARLALLWRNIESEQSAAADETRAIMGRLKFSNDEIRPTVELVKFQNRLAEYRPNWSDPHVKRLIRDTYPVLDHLFTLTNCSLSASQTDRCAAHDLQELRVRIDSMISIVNVDSPLDGNEIMEVLGIGPGRHLKDAKEFLLNAVIDGLLQQDDLKAARDLLEIWWKSENLK